MKPTIIFLNGFAVPISLSKTKLVWNDTLWKGYNRIYYSSTVPTSDFLVEQELNKLSKLINQYEDPIIAGHSLGAWWAANLICCNQSKIKKTVMWTPLGNTRAYPIFNVSGRFHPPLLTPNYNNYGNHKNLLFYGTRDLIVPAHLHISGLIKALNPTLFALHGGHFLQSNHKEGLLFMKQWIES